MKELKFRIEQKWLLNKLERVLNSKSKPDDNTRTAIIYGLKLMELQMRNDEYVTMKDMVRANELMEQATSNIGVREGLI